MYDFVNYQYHHKTNLHLIFKHHYLISETRTVHRFSNSQDNSDYQFHIQNGKIVQMQISQKSHLYQRTTHKRYVFDEDGNVIRIQTHKIKKGVKTVSNKVFNDKFMVRKYIRVYGP